MPEPQFATPSVDAAREVLGRFWGYPEFRPGQEIAIGAVLEGRDTLTIMPTGGGKSLCYQVPAMLLPGVTLVVSPLISLMKDQVDTLGRIGLPATFVNSTLSGAEMSARLRAAERGETKLLYVAPERFDSESFQERLSGLDVSLLAVDEAHCVSEWGHDFRPSYLRLARAREMVGNPPVAALTATATDEVRRDITRQLDLRDPAVLVTGFDRRNLTWHVLRAKNDSEKDRLLLRLLRDRDGSAIVYASTRKTVDALVALLSGVGVRTVGYHAGLGDEERKRVQEDFMRGEVPVVVATNAFGMGIDKSDVRVVVHYNMPGTVEAYYQEAGRAGRDGAPADCVLLHAYADRFTHEFFIEQAHPPRQAVEETLRALRGRANPDGVVEIPVPEFARTLSSVKGDRQVYSALRVLEDHGLVRQGGSGAPQPVRVRLVALPARITREVAVPGRENELRMLRGLWKAAGGEPIYRGADFDWRQLAELAGGSGRVPDLLDRLQAEGFVEWQAWGGGEGIQVLDRRTPPQKLPIDWRGLDARRERETRKLQRMQGYAYHERCRRGYLLRHFGDPAAMEECGACDNCLRPKGTPTSQSTRRGTEEKTASRTVTATSAPLSGAEAELYEALRNTRRAVAERAGLPPYFVFSEATLEEIARRRPTTAEALLGIHGVGRKTLEKYGHPFLELLRERGGGMDESPVAPPPTRTSARSPSVAEAGPATPEEAELYGALRTLRGELAREAELPAYCIFPDRTLVQIARERPVNSEALLGISGVGPVKLEKYGQRFLQRIAEVLGEGSPSG